MQGAARFIGVAPLFHYKARRLFVAKQPTGKTVLRNDLESAPKSHVLPFFEEIDKKRVPVETRFFISPRQSPFVAVSCRSDAHEDLMAIEPEDEEPRNNEAGEVCRRLRENGGF